MSKRKPMKTPRLVEVSWRDACSHHGWYEKKELHEAGTVEMRTVGYLVRRTKKSISLAQAVSEHGKCSEIWTIPTPWVSRIRRRA